MPDGKQTRGPWIRSKHGFNVLTGDSMHSICAVHPVPVDLGRSFDEEREEQISVARLIAAAPDMLDALKAIESCLAPEDNDYAARKVRAAIASAEGKEIAHAS